MSCPSEVPCLARPVSHGSRLSILFSLISSPIVSILGPDKEKSQRDGNFRVDPMRINPSQVSHCSILGSTPSDSGNLERGTRETGTRGSRGSGEAAERREESKKQNQMGRGPIDPLICVPAV